ncbi:LysR substrate-binding domain-containing protein, partial [Acetobacter sp. AN02]
AGHRIRSPDKGLGGMPPRHLSSHQPQAIKNGNSPFEWIQKGGHVNDPASDPLRQNSIDLYIGATDNMKPEIRRQTLSRDKVRGTVRKGHPILSGPVTPQSIVEYEYISVSRRGRARGPIDWALRDLYGLTRRIAMVVPNYHAMIESMKETDLILVLPGMVLDHVSMDALGLATFEFPFPLPWIEAFHAWHPRHDTDPVHRWLRETFVSRFQENPARYDVRGSR